MFTVNLLKTTINMREDFHAMLVDAYGARGISKAINEMLGRELLPKDDGFGKFKWMAKADIRDVRDEDDGDL